MSQFKIEIKWALIFAAMTLLWMFLEKMTGLHSTHIDKHVYYTNLVAIPAIIIYVLALLDKRKNHYGGTMTYRQGLMTGLVITLIIALLSPLTQFLITGVITTEYFPNAIAYAVENGLQTQEEAEAFFNQRNYTVQAVVGALIMGTLTTLIVAIFTRKK